MHTGPRGPGHSGAQWHNLEHVCYLYLNVKSHMDKLGRCSEVLHVHFAVSKVGVDAGPSWDWTTKFWELAYDGAVRDIKHHKDGEVMIGMIQEMRMHCAANCLPQLLDGFRRK